MDKTRRNFLKQAGWSLLEGGLLLSISKLLPSPVYASKTKNHLYAFLVDTKKCIGCGLCVDACKKENNVPEEFYRTWVERYTIMDDDEVIVDSPCGGSQGFKPQELNGNVKKSFFVPKLCNHCKKPNCVQVCPVGATYVSREGVVLVDDKHCVGCGYCIQACPYGARFINPASRVADKCTWCYHRLKKGFEPACVMLCPAGARQFGRLDDPDSPICKTMRENRLQTLKPETGNEPMTMYLGLDKEVR